MMKSKRPIRTLGLQLEYEEVSAAKIGGSFSVGCLPKHLAQPKGNALFPGECVFAVRMMTISGAISALLYISMSMSTLTVDNILYMLEDIAVLYYAALDLFIHSCLACLLRAELMLACFELERMLCPHRPPSSTIAINKHAQFSPHRDSGAGSGQTLSLIVGLGDYTGGEVVVEGIAHDIR